MSRRPRFHEQALEEIRSATEWYDRQRRGLGDEFLDTLDALVMQLADAPGLGGRLPGAAPDCVARRVLLTRFPYVVVFVEVDDEVRVISVMHAKRRPGYWMRRLTR
ncbi:MAG TPA: type II toxin-antitoxin system RelE/ParE family toxin [Labilithrix sp.]|nr:type II toxin-antitoxin system RelE/ParE family toxin [Labilithrix sp.]